MRIRTRLLLTVCLLVAVVVPATAQHPEDAGAPAVLSMQERADVVNTWLQERLDTVLPALMRRENVDMWIVSAREYNEDPVIETMLPATWMAARRRTMLVFYDRGPDDGVERLAISRYDVGDLFPSAWNPDEQPDQWARLDSYRWCPLCTSLCKPSISDRYGPLCGVRCVA